MVLAADGAAAVLGRAHLVACWPLSPTRYAPRRPALTGRCASLAVQAEHDGVHPGDAQEHDEGKAQDERGGPEGGDAQADEGRHGARSGQRPVEGVVTVPGLQARGYQHRRAEDDGRAGASIHAAAAGVRPSWACRIRLTIAAPMTAMAAVSGR